MEDTYVKEGVKVYEKWPTGASSRVPLESQRERIYG